MKAKIARVKTPKQNSGVIEYRELNPDAVRAQFRIRLPLLRKALERSERARRGGAEVLRMVFII